jgi:peptide/nickel transport system substrate-binding protein
MALNLKEEHLKNPKVREAIRYLVDYDGMANTFLKGQFKVHQAFWPSGFYASLDDNPYKLDVEKAKSLLKEAGYPDGFNIKIDIPNIPPFADIYQAIQSTMGQAGIKAEITQHDFKDVLTMYRARKHQITGLYWSPDYMDPHSNADSFARNPDNSDDAKSKPLAWRNAWDIPDLTKKSDAAVRERDPAKRKQMYLEIQKTAMDEGPFVCMFQPTKEIALRKNVQGYVQGATTDVLYYRLVTK